LRGPADDAADLQSQSARLAAAIASAGTDAPDFLLRGVGPEDFAALETAAEKNPSPEIIRRIRTAGDRLHKIAATLKARLRDYAALRAGDLNGFMKDHEAYMVADFQGDASQKPVMGSELSDFGSWYDMAYSGGINRLRILSTRRHSNDNEFFNTAAELAQLTLFFKTGSGEIIDGSDGDAAVSWYPYGWKTAAKHGGLEMESSAFFTAFNTIAVQSKVTNTGPQAEKITPSLLLTGRTGYNGRTGGRIVCHTAADGSLVWRITRAGNETNEKDFTDALVVGSNIGKAQAAFLPRYLLSGRGEELRQALKDKWQPSLDANAASADAGFGELKIAPGETKEFSLYIAAGADEKIARKLGADALKAVADNGALARAGRDWNGYLANLPKLNNPDYAALQMYYASAIALRKNRYVREQDGKFYDASFPARGGFNYFYQSDSCWNSLGYLDIKPEWATGHAVPILAPPSIIMDPHFYWSVWEMYSRTPDPGKRREFAKLVYPLLKETYRVWTTQIDIDGDLLVATPNNWDDNPRADLVFRELPDRPGWNSWWNDLVKDSRDFALDDPASSSQLGYGAVVMGRFAKILGKDDEAAHWARQFRRHVQAIDSLWDDKAGYWIVTYRGKLRDDVLTSSVLYPVFTGMARDPAKIKRVVEDHILNPAEFNGRFPIPTVAYNSPRYYKQMPPHDKLDGGLWRGNIWMPETWVVIKGLYKYGYEAQAEDIAGRLLDMMDHQDAQYPQFDFSPAEWYDSRTGAAQNNRAFSWSSAVAMDYLLGNYENERVVGSNAELDRAINGHIREIFDYESGDSLFRVKTVKTVFPALRMTAQDNLPIDKSAKIEFAFSDPGDNFAGESIAFAADSTRWTVADKNTGAALKPDGDGYYHVPLNAAFTLSGKK
jgi:hypothetical protein